MRPSSCLLAFVLAAGFLAAGARPAAACSCAGVQSPCQAFASSPIVFVGEVLSAERTGDDFHMRLHVVRALKGITAATADLWSDAGSSCGIKLDVGGRHVVYTSLGDGRMWIHACGYGARSRPANRIGPAADGGNRLRTRLAVRHRSGPRSNRSSHPLGPHRAGSPDGPGDRVSDQWGRSSSRTCRPANTRSRWRQDQGLTLSMTTPVVVAYREACVDTEVVLEPSGTVSGRVQTADGKPAGGGYVRLLPDGPRAACSRNTSHTPRSTEPDGRFTFEGLGPTATPSPSTRKAIRRPARSL